MVRRISRENIECCVFDAYGTLFDVMAAAARCADELGPKAAPLSALWRTKQLEYSWLRSLMGRYSDFWSITGDALDFAMSSLGLENDQALRNRLLGIYRELDAYPEVADTLKTLKAAGLRLAILSNGSPGMLDAAIKRAAIGGLLDEVVSADEIKIYKPSPAVYRLGVERLGVAGPSSICFLSSNSWDVAGAGAFGYRAVWIDRQGQNYDKLPYGPEARIESLAHLPALIGL